MKLKSKQLKKIALRILQGDSIVDLASVCGVFYDQLGTAARTPRGVSEATDHRSEPVACHVPAARALGTAVAPGVTPPSLLPCTLASIRRRPADSVGAARYVHTADVFLAYETMLL